MKSVCVVYLLLTTGSDLECDGGPASTKSLLARVEAWQLKKYMKMHKDNMTETIRQYREGISGIAQTLKYACVYFSTAFTPNINWGRR